MEKLQNPRGTRDVFGEEKEKMSMVENIGRGIAKKYGFREMETPIFEFTEVFARNIGETTDIVTKEMYTFEKGGDSLTLRPEGTAGIVRSAVSNGLLRNLPLKVFYSGPMFRYERPQKGRYRQFTQFGAEMLGVENPQADIEVIAMAYDFIESLGFNSDITVEINSLGDAESRLIYREKLIDYLKKNFDKLSEDSKNRLEKNPLRVLDSKEECDKEVVAGAPLYKDSLNEASQEFFNKVLEGLDALNIPYKVNPYLVRGLDYYTHTVFELTTNQLGSQGTVLAGGRYDGLVEQMGGGKVPGIGWACGVERLAMLKENWLKGERPIAIIPTGEDVNLKAMEIARTLRQNGFEVDQAYSGNMKKRFEKANKANAYKAVIIGSDELQEGNVTIKDLDSGEQELVAIEDVVKKLIKEIEVNVICRKTF